MSRAGRRRRHHHHWAGSRSPLFLAPIVHHFGWPDDDWNLLGAGSLVGHLLECAAQITGGYFADPGFKDVPNLANVGFPLAEVNEDGSAVITKLPTAGGMVTLQTVKEQLLYEIHDPGAYYTPDVIADFSTANLEQQGKDRVHVSGAGGSTRPEDLKVTVSFDGGYLAEAEVSYAGQEPLIEPNWPVILWPSGCGRCTMWRTISVSISSG